MALAIGGVVELVGPDRTVRLGLRQLLGEAAGDLHVIVRVDVADGRHLDQRRAGEPQHVLLFLALRLRNDDHRAVAERVADEREADAGIAGGALDDDAAGPERPALLGIADDGERGAVLDRLAGVHELGLAEDLAAGFLRGALQFDQGGVADRFDDAVADSHVRQLQPFPCRSAPDRPNPQSRHEFSIRCPPSP